MLSSHLKNILGYKTERKIVVIESDDWGSIRTKNREAYDNLNRLGLNMDSTSYTQFDTLESDTDLEMLFDVLGSHVDSTGRNPVITPMFIMANPEFSKIRESNFREYFFEPLRVSYDRYDGSSRVLNLIQEGISRRLFVPALHGREHLNVSRWMRLLNNSEFVRHSFDNESIGCISSNNEVFTDYLEAFCVDEIQDKLKVEEILEDAVDLFTDHFGYKPTHFIEPNAFGRRDLEAKLAKLGISTLLRAKLTRYSRLNGLRSYPYLHWIGKRNRYNQTYITRNCTFEPHRDAHENNVKSVENCLNEIEEAFRWKKPAVIISHRASYVGRISLENRRMGLDNLDDLLGAIVQKWPEVEFLTSMELGELLKP